MPAPITLDQMRTVYATLGLLDAPVSTVTIDATHGVTATLLVRDANGHLLADGDEPLTATIRIPLAEPQDSYTPGT